MWKVSERDKRAEGYNILQEDGTKRDPSSITTVRVRVALPLGYDRKGFFPFGQNRKATERRIPVSAKTVMTAERLIAAERQSFGRN